MFADLMNLASFIRKRVESEDIMLINFAIDGQDILEPRHDKTNKVTVSPAKTQISLGIRTV